MKKLFLLSFLFFSLHPISGQSFLKVRSNIFKFDEPSSQYKLGFGIGHERFILDKTKIKVLFGQNLDYKHSTFDYYDGGLGAGKSVFGTINFINAQLDIKARIGKKLFFETGLFSSLSLMKKITKGGTTTTSSCLGSPNQTVCPGPVDRPISNESDDFAPLDYGVLLGIGYTYKDYKIITDAQWGFNNIINLKYSQLATVQFNLSVLMPIKQLFKS